MTSLQGTGDETMDDTVVQSSGYVPDDSREEAYAALHREFSLTLAEKMRENGQTPSIEEVQTLWELDNPTADPLTAGQAEVMLSRQEEGKWSPPRKTEDDDTVTVSDQSGVGVDTDYSGLDLDKALADAEKEMKPRVDAQVAREDAAKTAEGEAAEKYAGFMEEAKAFQLNPFRLYENVGFAVVAAIASAIGAAGQALGGGDNAALKMIEIAINGDIGRQKHEYSKLTNAAAQQKHIWGMALNRYGDEKRATEALRAMALTVASKKMTLLYQKLQLEGPDRRLEATLKNQRRIAIMKAGGSGKADAKQSYRDQSKGWIKKVRDFLDFYKEEHGVKSWFLNKAVDYTSLETMASLVGDKDSSMKLISAYKGLDDSIKFVVNAFVKASGDSGNINSQEALRFMGSLESILPNLKIIGSITPRGRRMAISHSKMAMELAEQVMGLNSEKRGWKDISKEDGDKINKGMKYINDKIAAINAAGGYDAMEDKPRSASRYDAMEDKLGSASRMGSGFPYEKLGM